MNYKLILLFLFCSSRCYSMPATGLLIEGSVGNGGCEIEMSGSSPSYIDLGRVSPYTFKKSGGQELYSDLYTSLSSLKTFSVAVSGCSLDADAPGSNVRLKVSSAGWFTGTLGDRLFGGGSGQSTDAGVVLSAKKNPELMGNREIIGEGDEVIIYSSKEGDVAYSPDSAFVEFDAVLASTRPRPDAGKIVAPIKFTLINN